MMCRLVDCKCTMNVLGILQVVACRKMVDQISGMDFHDLNEQERQSLTMILKIAREIISKQGSELVPLHITWKVCRSICFRVRHTVLVSLQPINKFIIGSACEYLTSLL